MMRAFLISLWHGLAQERSECCNARIRNCYFELGYKKTECTGCSGVLQRLWWI